MAPPTTAPAPTSTLVDCIVIGDDVIHIYLDDVYDQVVVTRTGHEALVLERATAEALGMTLTRAAGMERPGAVAADRVR